MIEQFVDGMATYLPVINNALGAGFLIFMRVAGMMRFAPLLNRSEVPNTIRMGFAFLLTVFLMSLRFSLFLLNIQDLLYRYVVDTSISYYLIKVNYIHLRKSLIYF